MDSAAVDPVQNVMQAKQAAMQQKLQLAVLDKQLELMEQQGQMIHRLLQSNRRGVVPGRGAALDVQG